MQRVVARSQRVLSFFHGKKTCWEICIIHFPPTPPCSTRVDVLETGDVPILFSLPQMQHLGMTIELGPKRDKITCPGFGLYSFPDDFATVVDMVMDLTSLASKPKSQERSARPKKHVTFALSKQHIQLVLKNCMTTMMTNLLFVQTALPFLKKMKMMNFWCNPHSKKMRRSVKLLQHAEILHRYKEEKDLLSGEIRLPHWDKMRQGHRVSDQKKS